MPPTQSVEDFLKEYRDEVNIAVWSFYAWKNINSLGAEKKEIRRALNANATSWNIIAHSLQTTFFSALGRIFDRDNRSLTLGSFLRNCRAELGQFSRLALEARRLQTLHGVRPDWLTDFVSQAFEPTVTDFDTLVQATVAHEQIYRNNYEPIRHKVVAHNDQATIGSKDTLFANTNIGEVEHLLEFLYQVNRVVEEWYLNGRQTNLADHTLTEGTQVRQDLERLLNRLAIQVAIDDGRRTR
jgi:hypothetical protein